VQSSEENKAGASARAPRAGVRLMIIIFLGTALVAIYANVQKARREKIEKVMIIPAATATPSSATPGI
jgi:hypothetical protein